MNAHTEAAVKTASRVHHPAAARWRPAEKCEVEVFMMVRHYEIDFNSSALVFPGGSVDKGDQEIIARTPNCTAAARASRAQP